MLVVQFNCSGDNAARQQREHPYKEPTGSDNSGHDCVAEGIAESQLPGDVGVHF